MVTLFEDMTYSGIVGDYYNILKIVVKGNLTNNVSTTLLLKLIFINNLENFQIHVLRIYLQSYFGKINSTF